MPRTKKKSVGRYLKRNTLNIAIIAAVLLLVFGGRISLQSPGQAQEPQSEPPQSDKKDEAAEAKGETPAEEKPSDGFDRITIE